MKYPGATWRGPIPSSNFSKGREHPVVGVTIHHMDGSLASTDALFRRADVGKSAHFGTGRGGAVYQWVDTDDVSYHACNANWTGYIGIENDDGGEGLPLSDAQIVAIRGIIAWLGIDQKLMVGMSDTGVGYHSQFLGPCETHWGLTACPGVMIDQMPLLVAPVPSQPKGWRMSVMLCKDFPPTIIDAENKIAYEVTDPGTVPYFKVTPDQRANILQHYAH